MLKPFSHQPGRALLIPSTTHKVVVYPTLVRFGGKELKFDVEGPVKNFTVMQDLERVCITVFSDLYRIHILPNLEVVDAKNPKTPPYVHEVIDFGMHKKQEWEPMKKRADFQELFPIWFRLGSLLDLPQVVDQADLDQVGMYALLGDIKKAIDMHRPELIIPAFYKLFLAGFSDLFVPRAVDDEHQGIALGISDTNPLYLLTEGAKLIRSLFVTAKEDELALLPNCPPQLFAGKLKNIETPFGLLNFEWSKKQLRTLSFFPNKSGRVHIRFPSGLKQFRLRHTMKEPGEIHLCSESLEINSNTDYLLDNFQK